MSILSEINTLTTIHLSDVQKAILSKIVGSATPQTAFEEISRGPNMTSSRNILQDLGLIKIANDQATITSIGEKIMKDEALTDDMGQLTDVGNKFAQIHNLDDLKDVEASEEPEKPQSREPQTVPLESLTLFNTINNILREQNKIE